MANHDGEVKGPQQHAEGQQGEKTHAAFVENLHSRDTTDDDAQSAGSDRDFDEFGMPKPGHHRLAEDRQQHDEAEKNSETNRERR
jgi:hypothetical protein